jgi:hypothetical protein
MEFINQKDQLKNIKKKVAILMFVFKSKEFLGNTVFYKWEIVYNDNTIGTMNLSFLPGELELCGVSATAHYYCEKMRNITESDIKQIEKDFISLANNRLLDVDEVYSNLYVVGKRFDDNLDRFRYYM